MALAFLLVVLVVWGVRLLEVVFFCMFLSVFYVASLYASAYLIMDVVCRKVFVIVVSVISCALLRCPLLFSCLWPVCSFLFLCFSLALSLSFSLSLSPSLSLFLSLSLSPLPQRDKCI